MQGSNGHIDKHLLAYVTQQQVDRLCNGVQAAKGKAALLQAELAKIETRRKRRLSTAQRHRLEEIQDVSLGYALLAELAGLQDALATERRFEKYEETANANGMQFSLLCAILGTDPDDLRKSTAARLLGLKHPCERSQVDSAYRQAAKEYHPDKGGSDRHFRLVTDAYTILTRQG
ncbi:MAG: J domain-containing protein [Planctomycetota bacterium]